MHSLKYRVTTLSPVVISTISGDMNMVKTEQYIPGSTVLGLLAQRIIGKQDLGQTAHENDDFYNWFLAGRLKIGNAYFLSEDEYGAHEHYPTPLSIEREKYETGVYDFLFHDQQETERTERVENFCYLQDEALYKNSVETRINFHHARNREKGISEEGLIFNYESIAPDQIFAGEIYGEKEALQSLLNLCGASWAGFIGRSKNAEYSAIEFKFVEEQPVPLQSQFVWPKDDEGKPVEPASISMTLLSDLIFYNENGFPTTGVDELENVLRQHLGEVQIEKAFVKKNEIENFISVWRLKKPSETCFAAGSAFLLKVASAASAGKLAAVQVTGLGERTQEGFGRCAFGWQTRGELQMLDETVEIEKPTGSPPEAVKEIVEKILKKEIRARLALAAIHKMESFEHLLSNALIARLHAMAKSAGNRTDFVFALNNLRDIAMKQLRQCVSRDYNLLEYLAAFRLSENSLKGLEESGFDAEWLAASKKLPREREFTLVENLTNAIGKKPENRKEFEKFQRDILKSAEFCHNPVDWGDFFRQTANDDLKALCDEIEFKPEKDDEFTRELTNDFYTTFFAEMRKRKIAAEEGRDGEQR
jgi:CRISPR-associated protein Csx10